MILGYLYHIYTLVKAIFSQVRLQLYSIYTSLREKLYRLYYTDSSVIWKPDQLGYTDMNVPMKRGQVYAIDMTAPVKPYSPNDIYIYVGAGYGQEDGTYIALKDLHDLIHDRGRLDLMILAEQDYINKSDLEILIR